MPSREVTISVRGLVKSVESFSEKYFRLSSVVDFIETMPPFFAEVLARTCAISVPYGKESGL